MIDAALRAHGDVRRQGKIKAREHFGILPGEGYGGHGIADVDIRGGREAGDAVRNGEGGLPHSLAGDRALIVHGGIGGAAHFPGKVQAGIGRGGRHFGLAGRPRHHPHIRERKGRGVDKGRHHRDGERAAGAVGGHGDVDRAGRHRREQPVAAHRARVGIVPGVGDADRRQQGEDFTGKLNGRACLHVGNGRNGDLKTALKIIIVNQVYAEARTCLGDSCFQRGKLIATEDYSLGKRAYRDVYTDLIHRGPPYPCTMTFGKRKITNSGHALRKRDACQAAAAVESIIGNAGAPLWDRDTRQLAAFMESVVINVSNPLRDRDALQAAASIESTATNAGDALRDRDALKAAAIIESICWV